MAEAGAGGGDPILMIRGVLDMTQPYQELQNLGRAAAEGTTFSNSGTPGTSGSTAARERASRAVERQGDLGDVEQASFNVSERESVKAARRRNEIGTWGDTDGPTGGGVVRFRGRGDMRARSTGRLRRAYRQNEYSEDWESAVNAFTAASARRAAVEQPSWVPGDDDVPQGAGFDFPSGRGDASLEARADPAHEAGLAEQRALRASRGAPSSWSRRNFPTFRKMFGGGGSMSVFYRRFLITEAMRTVGALAEQASDYAGGIAATGGDPMAMAQFELNQARQTASAIPFGIGSMIYSVENGIMGTSTAVGQAQLTQMGEQGMMRRMQISTERLNMWEQSKTAQAPFGYQRSVAAIDQQLQADLRGARDREHAEMSEIKEQADREKAAIKARHQGAGLRESVLDDMGWYQSEYDAVDQAMAPKRADVAKRRVSDERSAQAIAGYHRLDAARERDQGIYNLNTETLMAGVSTERNPDEMISAQHERDIGGLQFVPEEFRAPGKKAADARRIAAQFQLENSRTAMGNDLALQETVSGITAQAFGPGANSIRRQAQLTQIAGSAELNAQSILRADSTTAGRGFADSARRIGINQLDTYQANYIQGMRSVARSRFEIAPGNQDSASPGQVFKQIDEAKGMLQRNVGNYDVSGSKDWMGGNMHVANILMQMLQVLQTGGPMSAQ